MQYDRSASACNGRFGAVNNLAASFSPNRSLSSLASATSSSGPDTCDARHRGNAHAFPLSSCNDARHSGSRVHTSERRGGVQRRQMELKGVAVGD